MYAVYNERIGVAGILMHFLVWGPFRISVPAVLK